VTPTSATIGGTAPVAVLGASGKTGRAVSDALLRRGVPVRGLVRRPGRWLGTRGSDAVGAASASGPQPVEVVADLDTGEGLLAAFQGCAAVYLVAPNVHPDEPALIRRALHAAREAGVARVVLHSVLHPYETALPHHMGKAVAEELVRASGLTWTVLQPCAYAQNLTAGLPAALDAGRLEVPYRIDAPFTLVDLDDVGQVAATVLTDTGHEAASYELCGPDAVTVADVAAEASRVTGRDLVVARTDPDAWPSGPGAGLPEYARRALHAMFVAYDTRGLVGGRRTLPWLLGRPSTPVAAVVARTLT
jgi:NAD(P)H dehydrogenase (quinone)